MKFFFTISVFIFTGLFNSLNAQYRKPRQGWIEPTNQEFTMKILAEKEARYKENVSQVVALNKEINLLIRIQSKNGLSESQLSYIKSYQNAIIKINNSNYDYGNSNVTQSVLNYLQQFYDEIYSW
ncbi:hypothetical protein [Epilithonimonas zeae]|uniref:hypothetical protein n=1 Tax=Epilithonimonas zeae TaxID=1416779 RepID=UPI00200C8B54|nr:hypothetical protein [Epilithonimonas zeae]UQB69460.1 hypothetical protein KI430_03255 [Epilithonimonas zeae]